MDLSRGYRVSNAVDAGGKMTTGILFPLLLVVAIVNALLHRRRKAD
jgi:hypothetical protein